MSVSRREQDQHSEESHSGGERQGFVNTGFESVDLFNSIDEVASQAEEDPTKADEVHDYDDYTEKIPSLTA